MAATLLAAPQVATAASIVPDLNAITTVTLDSSNMKIGVQLYDVSLGGQTYPAVKAVNPSGVAAAEKVEPGMIVLGNYKDASKAVVSRIQNGPYPLILQFYDLGRVGDYQNNPIPPQDALMAAIQKEREPIKEPPLSSKGTGLVLKTIQEPNQPVSERARRGDILEINFEARVASPGGPLYDSSRDRGGPVSFTMGSGEVVNGVDIGVYNMAVGEIRSMDIPASLGYGRAGSEYFDIPGDVRLWWKVELLGITKGEKKLLFKL